MLSVVSAVPVWLWIVLVNLAAVVWFATGEAKELQCESTRATLAVRVMVVLCACVLGSLFWLATRMGEQLRRQRLTARDAAPEPELSGFDAPEEHFSALVYDRYYRSESPAEWAARVREEQSLAQLRATQAIGRQA